MRVALLGTTAWARERLRARLDERGVHLLHEPDGLAGVQLIDTAHPDLVVTDAHLRGGMTGATIARRARRHANIGVVVIATPGDHIDVPATLRAGADDVLLTPLDVRETLARFHAVLRRSGRSLLPYDIGDLRIDDDTRRVVYRGHDIPVGPREFDVLSVLARRPDIVLTRRQLLDQVWHSTSYTENVVEVTISALRRKIERHGPRVVRTVRGAGYTLRA